MISKNLVGLFCGFSNSKPQSLGRERREESLWPPLRWGLPGRGKCVRNVLEPVWRRSLCECTHQLGLLDSVRARFCGRRLLLRRFVSCRSMEINVALVGGMRVTLPANSNTYRCGPLLKVTRECQSAASC